MKIISINGQGGTGKTTTAKVLLGRFENSAYISGDALVAVNPFGVNEKTDRLVIKNSISLVKNFEQENYGIVIICGIIRNQAQLDSFVNNLNEKTDFLFVWLRASKEVRHKRRVERARDGADNPAEFDFIDKIIPDQDSFSMKFGQFLEINTDDKTPEEVAEIIKKEIQ
ncbi:MAG: hypothetical protein HUT38_02975 [Candidatus Paceibacter sp.]|nr:hypothetical protein [Candidatus Paceibacter sp.]